MSETKPSSDNADPESKKTASDIHLLPCTINYDGPAPINSFFQVTKAEKNEQLVSHFRGRELKGKEFKLKDGVIGLNTIQVSEAAASNQETVWETAGVFDNIKVWDHDVEPNLVFMEECMDWFEVSQSIHSI